jgi:hypothetical protein
MQVEPAHELLCGARGADTAEGTSRLRGHAATPPEQVSKKAREGGCAWASCGTSIALL